MDGLQVEGLFDLGIGSNEEVEQNGARNEQSYQHILHLSAWILVVSAEHMNTWDTCHLSWFGIPLTLYDVRFLVSLSRYSVHVLTR